MHTPYEYVFCTHMHCLGNNGPAAVVLCHPVTLLCPCCALVFLQTLCSDVKLVLEALTNIPATRQRLIYRGRVLRDDSSLQELGG
jgi:hypothetical protein